MKLSPVFLQKLKKILLNKYVFVGVIFLGFLTFSGSYSLISRIKRDKEIKHIKQEIEYYRAEIDKNKEKLHEMRSSDANLEKFSREQYYLKKDSEDIYIIKEDEE